MPYGLLSVIVVGIMVLALFTNLTGIFTWTETIIQLVVLTLLLALIQWMRHVQRW